jgi:cytochrome c-type biogenesis protein CcmH/NrfF
MSSTATGRAPTEVQERDPTARVIRSVAAVTIACVVHWYESLLFLAPVALTVAAIWVTSRIAERRERREAAEDAHSMVDVAAFHGGA